MILGGDLRLLHPRLFNFLANHGHSPLPRLPSMHLTFLQRVDDQPSFCNGGETASHSARACFKTMLRERLASTSTIARFLEAGRPSIGSLDHRVHFVTMATSKLRDPFGRVLNSSLPEFLGCSRFWEAHRGKQKVRSCVGESTPAVRGIWTRKDAARRFDHGTYVATCALQRLGNQVQ